MRILDKISDITGSIFIFIFPYYDYYRKSRIILKRIAEIDKSQFDGNLQYVERLDNFKKENLKPFFDHTIEIKKSIEDKSKALLLSITVSITLIFGLVTILLNQDRFLQGSDFVYYAFFIIGLIAVLYMVIGAVMTLRLLSKNLPVYQLYPTDTELGENKQIELMATYIEQNTNVNILRRNLFYVSYQSIINSLSLLAVLFLLFNINLIISYKKAPQQNNELTKRVEQLSSNVSAIGALQDKQVSDIEKDISDLKYKIRKLESQKSKYPQKRKFE